MQILVTGSLAYDFIMDYPGVFADHINPNLTHNLNVSFLVDKLKKTQGGNGGNISYTLALLKAPVSLLATVGHDFSEYAEFLSNAGVDLTNITTLPDDFTSQAYIITDKSDNQISAFYPGAMNYNHNLKIANISPKPSLALISTSGPKAILSYVQECKELDIPYIFDPSQQITALETTEIAQCLDGAEIFIGNDYECEMVKKKLNFSDEDLLNKVKILITTLGEKGSIIKTGKQTIKIQPAKPQEVVDPTGAGDTYRAGFVSGFSKGLDLKTCGQMGAISACYAIEKYGTTSHKFSLEEFINRYKENFQENLNL